MNMWQGGALENFYANALDTFIIRDERTNLAEMKKLIHIVINLGQLILHGGEQGGDEVR